MRFSGARRLCTGDPARRLGNEYLYATVAAQNVETLNRYKPRRIVTQCPHCFHNLKNEYPDFGGNYTVLHEAEFIDELIQAGRLKPRGKIAERITYHDPCYMARHNRKWDSARSALGAIPGAELEEVEQSKNRTFCCGAGGGCFWKEEHEGTRINQKRFDQLKEAKPKMRRGRMPVLHDDDRRRGEVALAGRNDASPRPRRTGRRIHRRQHEVSAS